MKSLCESVYTECHINIPVIPYLEKHMGFSARLYEEDINICRKLLRRAATNAATKEQAFFWICRSDGSYCAAEQDVFIHDTTANQNCQSTQVCTGEKVHAFIIEVTGVAGNEVIGNVFKLDRAAYANEVRRFSQPALRAQNMPPMAYSVACHAMPVNPEYLEAILDYQKRCRATLAKAG